MLLSTQLAQDRFDPNIVSHRKKLLPKFHKLYISKIFGKHLSPPFIAASIFLALEHAAVYTGVPQAVDASFAGAAIALVDIPSKAAINIAFVAAKLTLGSGAGTVRGRDAGLFIEEIMCK